MWARFLFAPLVLCLMAANCLPAPPAVRENIEYANLGDVSLRLDAHVPPGPGPHPAAIIVHGGGWVGGDRRLSVQPLFAPLEQAGFAWFSISYRLAPQYLFPAPIDDVQRAVRWVRDNAREYNVDPQRIALIGESAGAHLAAMAALRDSEAVKAVVAFYPPTDLVDLARSSTLLPPALKQAVRDDVRGQFLLMLLGEMSPISHVKPGMPPFLLVHGTADTVVPYQQSVKLCRRMQDVGAACDLVTVEGARHGFRSWVAGPAREAYTRLMTEWLRDKLGGAVSADTQ